MRRKIITVAFIAFLVLFAFLNTGIYGLKNESIASASTARIISFSGYDWYVEDTVQRAKPGPNYWSNSPENVWLDENGWLHLKITCRNGRWYCSELTSLQTLGYGTYTYKVASRIDNIDKNVVVGLFAYKDNSHEVDIEFSKWGENNYRNGWFTIQPRPYIEGKNQKSFNIQLNGDYTTHYFIWSPRSVFFQSFHGHYTLGTQPAENIIESFTSNSQISAQGVKAHINFWLYKGYAPSNGMPTELVIRSFSYTPL